MKKPYLEILPPVCWQFTEALLGESKIVNDNRMSKMNVDITLDDLMRLFLITVEDSLEYEITTLIKNNKPLSTKENIERTIIDDRLERVTELIKMAGVTDEAIYAHIKMIKDQAFAKLSETNNKLDNAWSETDIFEDDEVSDLD